MTKDEEEELTSLMQAVSWMVSGVAIGRGEPEDYENIMFGLAAGTLTSAQLTMDPKKFRRLWARLVQKYDPPERN